MTAMSELNTPAEIIDHTDTVQSLGKDSTILIEVRSSSGGYQATYELSKISDDTFGVPRVNGERAIGPPIRFESQDDGTVTFAEGDELFFLDRKNPEKKFALGVLKRLEVVTRKNLRR